MLFWRKNIQLGIDIGTSSIKIVETGQKGKKFFLKNYALYTPPFKREKLISLVAQNLPSFESEIIEIFSLIFQKAKIEAKKAIISIPSFSTFFTEIELPPLEEEEIPSAIELQATQYVPIPLSEVTLEWQLIRKEKSPLSIWQKPITPLPREKRPPLESLKVLIVAIPKTIITRYLELAKALKLEVLALEVENFALVRSLLSGEEKGLIIILDIGGTSGTIMIVDEGFIRFSHILDFSSFKVIKEISKKLNISLLRAFYLEQEKEIDKGSLAKVVILPILERVKFEIEQTINSYLARAPQKKVSKIIITGGGANIAYLKEYFSKSLGIETEIGDPFRNLSFPEVLLPKLKEIGPRLSVAIGLSLYRSEKK